ncbi:triose-phosphate isomerase [Brachybacterium sp. FME24]|uniref:triose-phosphate isomerase n=1 Tax=Brachybacterium sp. FME24 TaxID=2742605 RepID=UPI001866B546|nr:triose-phosphate isomerase [Brachybacterium sp. FME24]
MRSPAHLPDRGLSGPLLIVNPKAYLHGEELLRLARLTDELAGLFRIPTIFTAQHADLRLVAEHTLDLTITAQHMDPITPGRGMGHVLPESLVDAGARAVVLNHAEHPLSIADLDATMERAREVGLATIVCADSDAQCHAIAHLGPGAMICEPTAAIGTGEMDAGDYIQRTTRIVKGVDPSILVIQAAGVSRGSDVARVLSQGADGSGGTSGIIKHPDWREILVEMYSAIRDHAATPTR